jgi:hypothetical protein
MRSVLFFTATTGYQARAFDEAAARAGVELVYATDRCRGMSDPWSDQAIPVRFHDVPGAVTAVVNGVRGKAVEGVLAVGDRPAVVAAHAARALGLPFHPPAGAQVAVSKVHTRGRLLAHGLAVPWFVSFPAGTPLHECAGRVRFPCVVKPVSLSASRGVMRADTPADLVAALARVQAILRSAEVQAERNPAHDEILVEGFIPGLEYALEGVMEHGSLRVLAVFAKPDPLDGPFFEETIYVTPPGVPEATERAMAEAIAAAAVAIGLHHGPVHAECRVNESGVFVLEIAPRPIGGLCARSLRFVSRGTNDTPGPGGRLSLEELLLRHACGDPIDGYGREAEASAVMMLPVPGAGRYRRVVGMDEARRVAGVEDIVVTAKEGELMVPLPEGHSYPAFIFARGPLPEDAVRAVRAAHGRLRFVLDTALPLTPS